MDSLVGSLGERTSMLTNPTLCHLRRIAGVALMEGLGGQLGVCAHALSE